MARGGGGGGRSGGHSGGGRSGGGGSFGGSRGFSGGSRGYSGGSRGYSGGGVHHGGPSHVYHHYSYGGRPVHYRRTSGGTGCAGCLTPFITFFVIMVVIFTFARIVGSLSFASSTVVRSTEKRDKLSSSLCNYNNEWYDDELGWIGRGNSTMIRGLENFYEKTGVQPYVALVSYDPQRTVSDEEYTNNLYDELFNDEGHMLFCYFACENDYPELMDGTWYYVIGRSAETVIDSEAKEIFESYLNAAYNDMSLDVDELFAEAFTNSGKAIMKGPVHVRYIVLIIVAIVAVVLIIFIAYKWWKKRVAQKNKEQEDLERILSRPLETFGDNETENLKKKYDSK